MPKVRRRDDGGAGQVIWFDEEEVDALILAELQRLGVMGKGEVIRECMCMDAGVEVTTNVWNDDGTPAGPKP